VPRNLKLDGKLVQQAMKLGKLKTKGDAINSALAEFVARRNRLRILQLEGQIDFDPNWDYKRMRRALRQLTSIHAAPHSQRSNL
jgi:Arc/MetJ family transcription regulator